MANDERTHEQFSSKQIASNPALADNPPPLSVLGSDTSPASNQQSAEHGDTPGASKFDEINSDFSVQRSPVRPGLPPRLRESFGEVSIAADSMDGTIPAPLTSRGSSEALILKSLQHMRPSFASSILSSRQDSNGNGVESSASSVEDHPPNLSPTAAPRRKASLLRPNTVAPVPCTRKDNPVLRSPPFFPHLVQYMCNTRGLCTCKA